MLRVESLLRSDFFGCLSQAPIMGSKHRDSHSTGKWRDRGSTTQREDERGLDGDGARWFCGSVLDCDHIFIIIGNENCK